MGTIVNERYALSLYEVAQEEGTVAQILAQLTALTDAMRQTPEFIKLLQAPSVSFTSKKEMLQQAFGGKIDAYLLNFLMLITEKGRAGGLLEMQKAYQQYYNTAHNICQVHAITAVPLDEELTDKLVKKLERSTGKSIVLTKTVDPHILGGIVLELGNQQMDTSIKTKLSEIAHKMTENIA